MPNQANDTREEIQLTEDRPISGKSEDKLGRSAFASRLAKAIASWKGDDGLVIGLYGPWGSGKTSVKNIVIEQLTEIGSDAPDILEFNPWQWSGHDDVSSAFFREVLGKLGRTRGSGDLDIAAKKMRRYAKFLGIGGVLFGDRGILGAILGILGLLGVSSAMLPNSSAALYASRIVAGVIALIGVTLIFGEKLLNKIADWLHQRFELEQRSLQDQKEEISKELRKYHKSILVVIDDVDRLSEPEIRTVFQLIKANADFPKFIYLVPFQRNIVECALGNGNEKNGAGYLEKIVQVGFSLPPIKRSDIENIFFEGLNALLANDTEKFDEVRWGNVYQGGLRQYFKNLREVKRFLGVFGFHLGLVRTDGVLDVNPIDLIALELLSFFEPDFYSDLSTRKELLTRTYGYDSYNRTELQTKCTSILEIVSDARQEPLRELMKELFPQVADAFGGIKHGSDGHNQWKSELRVCSPEIFDRYFELSLSPNDISQAEISRIATIANDSKGFNRELSRYAVDGRLKELLVELGPAFDKIRDTLNIADITIALLNIGEKLPKRDPGFFKMPPDWILLRLIVKVLQYEQDAVKREAMLDRAIREAESLGMAVALVGRNSDPEAREKNPESMVIRVESINQFQILCVGKIRAAKDAGKLFFQEDLAHLLFRWKDWTDANEVHRWVESLIKTQQGAITFLKAFLYTGSSQSIGDKVARVLSYIKLSDIEQFSNPDDIEQALTGINLLSLSQEERKAVDAFQKAISDKREGKTERIF